CGFSGRKNGSVSEKDRLADGFAFRRFREKLDLFDWCDEADGCASRRNSDETIPIFRQGRPESMGTMESATGRETMMKTAVASSQGVEKLRLRPPFSVA